MDVLIGLCIGLGAFIALFIITRIVQATGGSGHFSFRFGDLMRMATWIIFVVTFGYFGYGVIKWSTHEAPPPTPITVINMPGSNVAVQKPTVIAPTAFRGTTPYEAQNLDFEFIIDSAAPIRIESQGVYDPRLGWRELRQPKEGSRKIEDASNPKGHVEFWICPTGAHCPYDPLPKK